MPPDTLGQLRELAADIFGLESSTIEGTTAPENRPEWDSVNHLNLVLAIEQAFALQLDPEDIDGMKSIGAIATIVDRKRGSIAGG